MKFENAIAYVRAQLKDASKGQPSSLEARFLQQLQATGLVRAADGMEREFVFHPVRRWRFDFAWPKAKVAVEVEGLTYDGGRHQTIQGFEGDCQKYNAAVVLGWRVLRGTGKQVARGELLADLEKLIGRYQR